MHSWEGSVHLRRHVVTHAEPASAVSISGLYTFFGSVCCEALEALRWAGEKRLKPDAAQTSAKGFKVPWTSAPVGKTCHGGVSAAGRFQKARTSGHSNLDTGAMSADALTTLGSCMFDDVVMAAKLPAAVVTRFNECLISGAPTPEDWPGVMETWLESWERGACKCTG